MKYYLKICLPLLIIIFFTACSNTKYLAPGQNLYVGSEVKIHTTAKISKGDKKDLSSELNGLTRPKPNSKILGMRIKLLAYNLAGTPKKKKGIRHWLKYKFGEAPVIASASALKKNSAVLQNHLENKGYFHDTVTLDTTVKSRKLKAIYTATFGAQYKIRNVTYPTDTSTLSKAIQRAMRWSFLKKGKPYDLDVIKAERERIDARLKQKGFYYFGPDYILAKVDSTVGNHQVDIGLQIKPETPGDAKRIFSINDVIVFADYDINSDTSLSFANTNKFHGYTIVDPNHRFNPHMFLRTLVFKPGDIYNRNDHNLSLNRLITLGVYKFVKIRFEDADTAVGDKLNVFYYLTPTEKKSIRAEVSSFTKSDNATGGQVSVSWRNRNLLKGAELLTVSAYAGLEKQISAARSANVKRYGADLNLYVPRIIAPFNLNTSSAFVPKTRFNLGYEMYSSDTAYTLNSFRGSAGYVWKNSLLSENQLNLISLNYVKPSHIDTAFAHQLLTNPTLARSLEKQFIIGSNYNYNYNTQNKLNYKKNNFYFNGNLDLSGNIIGLLTGANVSAGKQVEILSVPFAQYIRGEVEFRHYLKLGKPTTVLASRIMGGLGYTYGNSTSMPFIKAFFAGGTNDIRAFRARSLGPGSFYAGDPLVKPFIPEQPGDIKLEANTELRAKLFSIVRGAIFVDAGNVWTQRNDSSRPGAKFSSNFLNQIAVGTGVGLRFDINILVLRVDLAFPVRKPWLPSGSQWVLNQINFGSSDWRRENLIVNLAIGYPF
ncbi:MAG: BamA/TamA family outer membrane protein [Chitinophagaceae bacterium]